MAKTKSKKDRTRGANAKVDSTTEAKPPHSGQAIRETVESFVIAVVLAFLFRTFEAEAFVIPTGSMANTLMGQHLDIECPQCNHRYRVSASDAEDERNRRGNRIRAEYFCISGTCPVCRYTLPIGPLPPQVPVRHRPVVSVPSYSGDRILVNKYIYDYQAPERNDVVVFRFPGDANTNYIKRLVGLPGETIRIHQGDLFAAGSEADAGAQMPIARKDPSKVLAMRTLVHDTDHDSATLHRAGWPLRWSDPDSRWQVTTELDQNVMRQRFSAEGGDQVAWLRYRHTPPSFEDWNAVLGAPGDAQIFAPDSPRGPRPQLIEDYNPYNSNVLAVQGARARTLEDIFHLNGVHWVGDLILEAEVTVESAEGELLLELVEAGKHFVCAIDLASGKATLRIEEFETRDPIAGFSPSAETDVQAGGSYHLRFANVDDQLLLWVDGDLVQFDSDTAYDVAKVFGNRSEILPRTSQSDPGDLAPVAIGQRNAKVEVDHLQVWRDIYYLAVRMSDSAHRLHDYDGVLDGKGPSDFRQVLRDPQSWDLLQNRRQVEFTLKEDQFFVLGDNSPASQDARLWSSGNGPDTGQPGGAYLERQLLIGKALCVYWPHSWGQLPGTPVPFPLFPNFPDMRLVR